MAAHYRSMVFKLAIMCHSIFGVSAVTWSIAANAGVASHNADTASSLDNKRGRLVRRENKAAAILHASGATDVQEQYIDGKSHRADCDRDVIATTAPPSTSGQTSKSSFSWRARIVHPCQANRTDQWSYQWDVSNIEFFQERCENITTALVPDSSLVSGTTEVAFNKELAFDSDPQTKWRGLADGTGQLWIAGKFTSSQVVQCIKITQCDCLRSARAMVVEYVPETSTDEIWLPLPTQDSILWGSESTLDVIR